jgi:hypothetical protein
MRPLPLTLLVLGIAAADHPNDSSPADDLAVFTNRFDATTHLHFSAPRRTFIAELTMIIERFITLKMPAELFAKVTLEPLPVPW